MGFYGYFSPIRFFNKEFFGHVGFFGPKPCGPRSSPMRKANLIDLLIDHLG